MIKINLRWIDDADVEIKITEICEGQTNQNPLSTGHNNKFICHTQDMCTEVG